MLKLLSPARPDWQFLGVDIAAPAVELVEGMNLPNVRGALFDGRRLPAEDKSFDLAILSHVIEHVEDTRSLIQEAVRVAPWILVEVPIESTPVLNSLWWFRAKLGRPRTPNDLGHLRFCSRSEWDRLLEQDGLTVVRQRQYTARKDVIMFGKQGSAAFKARLKVLGERVVGSNLWGKLYLSNYAVLARGS